MDNVHWPACRLRLGKMRGNVADADNESVRGLCAGTGEGLAVIPKK